jgi:HD-GYP domain-containing protein (c-di-GMP phosphodiesterase class II)
LTQKTVAERTEQYKQSVKVEFENAVEIVEKLYRTLAKGVFFSNKSVLTLVRKFTSIFKEDQSIIINLMGNDAESKEYLFSHALRVCLCAMNIAAACDYSEEQVEEVGAAALLADIGMLFVPDEVRFKKGKLNRSEFFEIQKHPMLGIAIIEKIIGIRPIVANTAYQHHERVRGIGYPKTRKGPLILQYTRLVSIADVYEALCSQRCHRKAYLPHAGIVILLKMARANILDRDMVREFVRSTSLYPVGSMVKLTDGRVAKVIEPRGEDIKNPLISVLTDTAGNLLFPEDVHQIELQHEPALNIDDGIETLAEVKLMDGF